MKVEAKKLADGAFHLKATATPQEVADALQAAKVAFAQSMGMQPIPDKTIDEVAEASMGIKNLDSLVEAAAIESLIPYALDKKNIIPSYMPSINKKGTFKRGESFYFELDVVPKPEYELTSYDPLDITLPVFEMNNNMVDAQMAEMANNYTAWVKAPDKPLEKGDSCLIALKCFEDGKELKGLTTEGRTFTAGKGYMPDGFEKNVIGMQPGETKTFTFEAPGLDDDLNEYTQVVDATVTLIEIQQPEVPVIDDAWVKKNMPFYRDVEDLRKDVARSLEQRERQGYENYKLQTVAAEIAKRFQGAIADEVYESMQENVVNNMRLQLQQQGKSWEEFVAENGGDQQVSMMVMLQTREMLVQGFALDAVFRHEKLAITDEDIDATCLAMSPQTNPKQTRKQIEEAGRGVVMREAAERMKANKWLLEHANVTYIDPHAQSDTVAAVDVHTEADMVVDETASADGESTGKDVEWTD